MDPVSVELVRGALVESRHRVHVAVCDPDGPRLTHGDPDQVVFLRSSAKVIQALACVMTGAADRYGFGVPELALAAASHNGEEIHTTTAARMLAAAGLGPSDLGCGLHAPFHGPARDALSAAGVSHDVLHNNCSGKHAAMLAACVASGWSLPDYLEPDHPLQRLNRANVAAFAGVEEASVVLATDGCSAPVFAVPLLAAARLFLAFAEPHRFPGLSPEQVSAAERVRDAIATSPAHLAGTDREDSDLIRVTEGRVLAKVGAEGIWCLAARDPVLGIAVACEDGARRAATAVGLALLRRLGALDDETYGALARHTGDPIRNHRDTIVGRTLVRFPDETGRP